MVPERILINDERMDPPKSGSQSAVEFKLLTTVAALPAVSFAGDGMGCWGAWPGWVPNRQWDVRGTT